MAFINDMAEQRLPTRPAPATWWRNSTLFLPAFGQPGL